MNEGNQSGNEGRIRFHLIVIQLRLLLLLLPPGSCRRSRCMSCSSGDSRPTEWRAQGRRGKRGPRRSGGRESEGRPREGILMGTAAARLPAGVRSVGLPAGPGEKVKQPLAKGGNEGQKLRSTGVLQLAGVISSKMKSPIQLRKM